MKSKPLHLVCLLSVLASTLFSVSILAQVPTRFIDKTDKTPIEELIPGAIKDLEATQKILPIPDIQRAIIEHEREGRGTYLFAARTNTSFSLSDGQFYENKNYPDKINWKLTIKAPGAKSLSFHFSNVNIPEGTELFVYNLNEGMIFGPVTSEVLGATEFISDIVYGDHATIEAIIPIVYVDLFSINIEAVNYGFKDGSNNERAFGQSAPCNNNIQCFSAGYSVHRGAVCVTVVGGTEDLFWHIS